MTFLTLVNILLVISAIIGMYLVAHKDKRGFVIFTIVEASMGYIGMSTRQYGLTIAAIIYFMMNCYSYAKWSKWI